MKKLRKAVVDDEVITRGISFARPSGMPKRKRDSDVDTPFKARVSRHFQSLGGAATWGAAAATAREFGIDGTDGSARVVRYDTQIRDGTARRKRSNCGREPEFDEEIEEQIVEAFDANETQTYREAAETLGMAKSTLHNYMNKFMDYRCLTDTTRPLPTADNLEARLEQSQDIIDHDGPYTDEFHQDEKYFIINSCRRKRKVRKSDTQRSRKKRKAKSRSHQTNVMFTGCVGVGPDGEPIKLHHEWVSKDKTALRSSKNHKRGDVYKVSATMNKADFLQLLRAIGSAIRTKYVSLGLPGRRVKLQIDSAGGHGMARSQKNFDDAAKFMLSDYNILLVKQPPNSPMFNVLDLVVWQGLQLEIDKMNHEDRNDEAKLVAETKRAFQDLPDVKILRAFEMRRDVANEALRTKGWCDGEGKGGGGAHRVHADPAYAALRARLGIPTDPW